MTKTLLESIHERRRVLQNPYAFLEELEEIEEIESVRQDRHLLENPYAHIEKLSRAEAHVHRFDGLVRLGSARAKNGTLPERKKKGSYAEAEIERIVRDFQRAMWRDREKIFGDARPTDPLDVLEPAAAFHYLGFEFELSEGLGQFADGGLRHEVAGTVDQEQRKVQISAQFPLAVRNFTAAHELAHALLHDTVGLHRDRPLEGASSARPQQEWEADKFATFFLMPRKLVLAKFKALFGAAPFELNEETRFALLGAAAEDPKKWPRSPRELAKLLAAAVHFNGQPVVPLATQFRVSVEAMAIRLEELTLVPRS